jgi:alpha-L-rhamnosidase
MRNAFFGAAVAACIAAAASASSITPVHLRCEYRVNPLGIAVAQPRLTWELSGDAQDARQTAYQILVSNNRADLDADVGILWDSGKVVSDETVLIPYAGSPLGARLRCFWKVRVWDEADRPSAWSETAYWSMGLLDRADWQAQWIGYDAWEEEHAKQPAPEPELPLQPAAWIWSGEGKGVDAPAGARYFRRQFLIEHVPVAARIFAAADNHCQLFVNGRELIPGQGAIDGFRQVYALDATAALREGDNVIAIAAKNAGDAPNPAGVIALLEAVTEHGAHTLAHTGDGQWKVADQVSGEDWKRAGFDAGAWPAAKVVAAHGEAPWGAVPTKPPLVLPPAPYLRKEFTAARRLSRAMLYVSALGIHEVYLNGARVGEDWFAPGWTDYAKRIYYRSHEVTDLVRAGRQNALGVILADGWYAGYIGFRRLLNFDRPRNYYGGEPRLLAQLELEYENGEREVIATDESWRASYGEIREADLLMGEMRDLTRRMPGWDQPGYDAAAWSPVVVGAWPDAPLQPHPGNPVRLHEVIPAVSVREYKPGIYVYDLGQNITGVARLTVRGPKGAELRVRHAERLDTDGGLYTANLREARATDRYILPGGTVTLEPRFTFHGFQYVEVAGLESPPAPEAVQGLVLHSEIPQTGSFECSEPLLNQLFHNIVWGQKGNYLEIPTDCPQRDERLGWTGDAQFFMPTACYTADIGAFFTKWLVDLVQDAQFEDGKWGDIAPNIGLGGGAVAWGDAAIICTYQMYRYYGDTRIIQTHFDALVRGMDFLERTSRDFIRKDLGYGDWVNLGGGAKDEVICTAYYAYLAGLMAEMAAVIGHAERAAYYRQLHDNIRAAFVREFVGPDGKILDSSQTGYALAFTMDLIPEDRRAAAADRFVEEIAKFDHHLATGFIGTPRLLPALSKAGRRDVAYALLMNRDYPSWLFQVTLGATTMWERWDGWTPDKGFQTPGMNSFNHYAFGSVGEFLYSEIGGIQPLEPSFKKVRIAPKPGGGLTWAKTAYHSIRGSIRSDWRLENNRLMMEVTVPPNVTAEIHVPTQGKEFARPADGQGPVPRHDPEESTAIYEVGGGTYAFSGEIRGQ